MRRRGSSYGHRGFAGPDSRFALRAASKNNPRNLPCPTCGQPNMLTPERSHSKVHTDIEEFRKSLRALELSQG